MLLKHNVLMMVNIYQLLLLPFIIVASPITHPLVSDADIDKVIPDYFDNKRSVKKYHLLTPNTSAASELKQIHTRHEHNEVAITENSKSLSHNTYGHCVDVDFKLQWTTTINSPVFATPIVFPKKRGNQEMQLFLNSYYQYIELIDCDGFKPWGWPLSFEDSSFQSSPILYDIDSDGNIDIGVVDKNANLYWIRTGDFGEYLENYHIQVPGLKIKRNWAEHLDPNFVDSSASLSMFDRKRKRQQYWDVPTAAPYKAPDIHRKIAKVDELNSKPKSPIIVKQETYPELGNSSSSNGGGDVLATNNTSTRRRLSEETSEQQTTGAVHSDEQSEDMLPVPDLANIETLPPYLEGQDDIRPPEGRSYHYGEGPEFDRMSYESVGRVRSADDGLSYYMGKRYAAMQGGSFNDSEFVFVDAHVLSTPTIADINQDGHMEIIFSVSYYFDKLDYANKNVDFDPEMYVAGGVVCWDMQAEDWTWLVHLDLTTSKSKFQAMIYGSPTVADLDGDGRNEIVVGTALGLLYLLDGESGFTKRFFPLQFHSIQAQVAVGDVMGGADLEMIVADMGGTLAVVNSSGDILWDVQLSGKLPFTPTIGDVDGDGTMDIVVVAVPETPSHGCHVWAVHGDSGKPLDGYPISLPMNAMISAPVILANLHSDFERGSLGQYSYRPHPAKKSNSTSTLDAMSFPAGFSADAELASNVYYAEGVLALSNKGASKGRKDGSNSSSQVVKSSGNKVMSAGLHLIVTSFEGHIYVIDGSVELDGSDDGKDSHSSKTKSESESKHRAHAHRSEKCAQRIDIGEHIYSTPVLVDMTGDGYLDLLVGTMNGRMLLFETAVPFHPVNAWNSFPKNRLNGFTHGDRGIFLHPAQREKLKYMEIKGGQNLSITFEIWDSSVGLPGLEPRSKKSFHIVTDIVDEFKPFYTVTLTRGLNRLTPLYSMIFDSPGKHTISVPINAPEDATFVLSMVTEHGLYYEDSFNVQISSKFYVWIKYMVLSPVIVFCTPLILRTLKTKH